MAVDDTTVVLEMSVSDDPDGNCLSVAKVKYIYRIKKIKLYENVDSVCVQTGVPRWSSG